MAKAKLTFMGGIHPYDGKDLSKDKPMKAVLPKGDLVFPLSQHIGAPARPVVAKETVFWPDRKSEKRPALYLRRFSAPYQVR